MKLNQNKNQFGSLIERRKERVVGCQQFDQSLKACEWKKAKGNKAPILTRQESEGNVVQWLTNSYEGKHKNTNSKSQRSKELLTLRRVASPHSSPHSLIAALFFIVVILLETFSRYPPVPEKKESSLMKNRFRGHPLSACLLLTWPQPACTFVLSRTAYPHSSFPLLAPIEEGIKEPCCPYLEYLLCE